MKSSSLCMTLILLLLPMPCPAQHEGSELAIRIDEIMRTRSEAGDFSGVALVARRGNVLYQHAFGLANREWNVPNDLDTKFEIGSMTKQFTAMLILQMANEGKLRLDGHLSDYLPYYRHDTGDQITISELLSHTSGVPSFTSLPGFLDGPESRTHYTVQEFVKKYCSGNLEFVPGTKFDYSNSGYFLLGAVLEQVSGNSYEDLLQHRIFDPLGMKNSGYTHTGNLLPHRAAGYERIASGFQNARFYDMSIPFSAGALYSTVGDLFLWDQALYTGLLLPAKLRDLMFKPNLEDYGYGWVMLIPSSGQPYAGDSIPMHGGSIFGFQSVIQRLIQHRELIVLLDNNDDAKLLDIALEIRRALAKNP